jgi:hypothetical protein
MVTETLNAEQPHCSRGVLEEPWQLRDCRASAWQREVAGDRAGFTTKVVSELSLIWKARIAQVDKLAKSQKGQNPMSQGKQGHF